MFGLLLRAFSIIVIGLALTACGPRVRPLPQLPQIYDIRGAAVTANAGISRTIMRGIKLRLDKAIQDTLRPMPMPRAVMNVHIVGVAKLRGLDGTRTETEISVALTDVPSGQALQVRSFLVYSFSINERDADESAAEAVASRLRVEYALSQPVLRAPQPVTPRLSTRMDDDIEPTRMRRPKSIVIPLKTAPVVGADEDPVLNSKTKVEPAKKNVTSPSKTDVKPKNVTPVSTDNAVEDGAKAKVVIKPTVAKPVPDEPCVETMDNKC